jgi:2-amino-4-hydroxy-6-hydroxymethyldihydropteridine diphosphokinase
MNEKEKQVTAYAAVGANIDPEANIEAGIKALAEFVRIADISTLYVSKPSERPEQPDFINGVLKIETSLNPLRLKFDVLRKVESRLGRVRGTDRHAARTLDLDLILYEDQVIRSDELTLPAPDIYRAAYVAYPLAELAPRLVLPDTEIRVRDLKSATADTLTALPALTAFLKGWLNK